MHLFGPSVRAHSAMRRGHFESPNAKANVRSSTSEKLVEFCACACGRHAAVSRSAASANIAGLLLIRAHGERCTSAAGGMKALILGIHERLLLLTPLDGAAMLCNTDLRFD